MTNTATSLVFTPHPIVDVLLPPIDAAAQRRWMRLPNGDRDLLDYWERHEGLIRDAGADPLNYGFELPFWPDLWDLVEAKDETYALGGNGVGKTEIGAKMVVKTMLKRPGMKVLCISQNETTSIQIQQASVYKYSPVSAREHNEKATGKRREAVAKFRYSQAGGFTLGTFVYPNGSQCWFKTVEQFERDPTSFEGPEYDLIWPDEPIPLPLREALSYRAGKRAGKFLFTFTAVNGYDQICAMILEGAKVVRSLPMNWQWKIKDLARPVEGGPDVRIEIPELKPSEVQIKGLPAGHMPYIMQPMNPAQGIIFLWTHWNVFLPRSKRVPDAPALFDKCLRKPRHTVKTRLFGWTEKLAGSQFPNFNTNVHVIPHERILDLLRPRARRVIGVTSYMSLDPATARSYFLLWVLVDAVGRKYVFDECPRSEEGEWVGEDGAAGDGQLIYAGRGVNFYKTLIRAREREHTIEALRRFGDPRAFATAAAAAHGAQSLFDLFQEAGDDDEPETAPLFFEPAQVRASLKSESETGSLEKINDALSYDPDRPFAIGHNEPMLYFSDRCQNIIRSVINWNPSQGEKSPWKDPADCLRYLFGEDLYYTDPSIPLVRKGKGWGAR